VFIIFFFQKKTLFFSKTFSSSGVVVGAAVLISVVLFESTGHVGIKNAETPLSLSHLSRVDEVENWCGSWRHQLKRVPKLQQDTRKDYGLGNPPQRPPTTKKKGIGAFLNLIFAYFYSHQKGVTMNMIIR